LPYSRKKRIYVDDVEDVENVFDASQIKKIEEQRGK
jgi:hypothetical protein